MSSRGGWLAEVHFIQGDVAAVRRDEARFSSKWVGAVFEQKVPRLGARRRQVRVPLWYKIDKEALEAEEKPRVSRESST